MSHLSLRTLARAAVLLALPAGAFVGVSPARAADLNVVCVGAPIGVTCDSTAATINAATTGLQLNGLDDLIAVGPGTYDAGSITLNGGANELALQGSGDSTVITLPTGGGPATTYIFATDADVRNLKVAMTAEASHWGLNVTRSLVENVTIDGPGATSAAGIIASNSTVDDVAITLAPNSGRGVNLLNDGLLSDAEITAGTGVIAGAGGVQRITRALMKVTQSGVYVEEGEVTVDNTVIDLGTSNGVGLRSGNSGPGQSSAFITADHLTIVGGGGSSRGAYAIANAPEGKKTSTVLLSNSVIQGPAFPILLEATNDGNQGGDSEAFVGVSYTAYDDDTSVQIIDGNGIGGISAGAGNLDVDPQFTNAAAGNYLPAPDSPLIDAGNPAASAAILDVVSNPRVADGNGDITAVRDLGAYEVPDTFSPETLITGATASPTRDRTPTVKFTSEPGATFTCKVDTKAAVPCASPFTAPSLTNGTHKIAVTARDSSANADPTPATRTIVVDTIAPNTRFLSNPPTVTSKSTVRFTFTASGAIRYQCRLDARAWAGCGSPKVITVAKGRHTFAVRAIDRAGNVDPTPARYTFRRR